MRNKLITVALFLVSLLQAQKKNIQLPKSNGFEITYIENTTTPIFSIYIDKEEKIFLEDIKLEVEQLGDSLFYHKLRLPDTKVPFLKVLLYADKSVKYSVIDAVKSQLKMAHITYIFYRTNNINDITQGAGIINQGALSYLKKTANKGEATFKLENLPIKIDSTLQFIEDLYNKKFEKVKSYLSTKKYATVKFLEKNKVIINNVEINLRDEQKFLKMINNLDFYFLKTPNTMKYDDYFNNISFIIKLNRKSKTRIPFIEISGELQKVLNKEKIQFLNKD